MKNEIFQRRLLFAWSGIRTALRNERSFRTQMWFAAAVAPALLILRPALIWWALVGITVALVLAAELINTALENLADHLHPEQHPRIKLVKDCAAGAVLVLSVGAVWVGLLAVFSVM